jgi:hypothetical protein
VDEKRDAAREAADTKPLYLSGPENFPRFLVVMIASKRGGRKYCGPLSRWANVLLA